MFRSSALFATLLQMPPNVPLRSWGPGVRRLWSVWGQVGWNGMQ